MCLNLTLFFCHLLIFKTLRLCTCYLIPITTITTSTDFVVLFLIAFVGRGSGRAPPQARPVQVAGPEQPQLDPVLRGRAAEAQEPQREAGPAARRDPRCAQPLPRPDLLHRERVLAQRALQLHAGQGEHRAGASHRSRVQVRRVTDRGRAPARTTKANCGKRT